MTEPVVTIVMPVYNAESWIEETLGSVIHQDFPLQRLELILVDDGSTDASVSNAESLLHGSSLSYQVVRTANGGPSQARNKGWRRARGNWIQFLDADDLLAPAKIAAQAPVAEGAADTIAVLYSPWQRLGYREGQWLPIAYVAPSIGIDVLADLLKLENFMQLGCLLFRKSWLERAGGFDERYWLIEDVDLLLRLAIAGGRFCEVAAGGPLFQYRQRTDSLSQTDSRKFIEACLRNARLVEEHAGQNGGLSRAQREALARVHFHAARALAVIEPNEARRLVERVLDFVPGYVPPGPWHLRWLSRLIGYRRAERVAQVYRQVKRGRQ